MHLGVEGLYGIIPLQVLRRTKQVMFDMVPMNFFSSISAIDRVIHEPGARSPGSVGKIEKPWYMHSLQTDNLLVLAGKRHVEIFTPQHGAIEVFTITPDRVILDGSVIYDGPAILVWYCGVFHRIESDIVTGSASLNLAIRFDGFDIKTNFNVYDLDPRIGKFRVIREGHLDQPESVNNG